MRVPAMLVLAALLLSGCFGGSSNKTEDGSTVAASSTVLPPYNRSGSLAAFRETSQTENGTGAVAHAHDYWQGRDRAPLLEQHVFFLQSKDVPVVDLAVPSGTMVYEGTGAVEIKLYNAQRNVCANVYYDGSFVCTERAGQKTPDPLGASGFTVRAKHASATQWIDLGAATWGQPISIKITDPTQTDMPHSSSSLWRFQLVGKDVQDRTLSFDVKVEIVRAAGPIAYWPPHPKFYADTHNRTVFEGVATFEQNGSPVRMASAFALPVRDPRQTPVTPQRLVSYGTRTLTITATVTQLSLLNPAAAPAHWVLSMWNASGTEVYAFDKDNTHTMAEKTLQWVVRVDDGGMDSPYADASRWGFYIDGEWNDPAHANFHCWGDCATFHLEVALKIVASDLPMPFVALENHP